jgi:hypothetical protein
VKNHRVHDVPMPRSWLERMLPECAAGLGLPRTATLQQVLNAQRAERARREKLARTSGDSTLHWYNVPVDPQTESWLFVDTETGLPVRSETHNDRWHKVRRWVAKHDPEHEWPQFVPYRNMRHHAATFWHDELGREWVDVASFLGDELTTVLSHYVLPGAEALVDTVKQLEDW